MKAGENGRGLDAGALARTAAARAVEGWVMHLCGAPSLRSPTQQRLHPRSGSQARPPPQAAQQLRRQRRGRQEQKNLRTHGRKIFGRTAVR